MAATLQPFPRGRKRTPESNRKTITIRVAPETAARIKALRADGFKVGRWLDDKMKALAVSE